MPARTIFWGFRILNFTISWVWSKGGYVLGTGHLQVFFGGPHSKLTIFGSIEILSIIWGFVRIGVKTFYILKQSSTFLEEDTFTQLLNLPVY